MRVGCGSGRLSGVTEPEGTVTDEVEQLVEDWLTLPEVGERLGLEITRVRQLVRERQVLAVRRGPNRVLMVPSAFITDGQVLKGLPGLLTVLLDDGYADEESLRWLFTPEETLPGSPVQALRENRGTEVTRRAQALAF